MQSIKCVVVGDGAVGKTCLRVSYTKKEFPKDYRPTTFETHAVPVKIRGRSFTLNVSDTSGQEDYDQLRTLSYLEADVFLVCFSVDSPASLKNAKDKWVPDISGHERNAPFLLVGTKTDLRDDDHTLRTLAEHNETPVTMEEGRQLAEQIEAAKYVECSALEKRGLKNVFDEAIMTVLELRKKDKRKKTKKCVIM